MRNTLITGLAVAGVVTAGTAAAAVNTSIFSGPPANASAAPDIIATPPTSLAQPGAAAVAPIVVRTADAPAESPVKAPVETLTEYRVGDAGSVTLAIVDGELVVEQATPTAGWMVADIEHDPTDVDVLFVSADTEVEFSAELIDGRVETFVEASAAPQAEDAQEDEEYEDD